MSIFKRQTIPRSQQYLDMMNQWFILNQRHMTIVNYLEKQGFHTAAVYGMGLYGRHLVRDLTDTGIKVLYGVDRNKMPPYEGVEVRQLEKVMPEVDVVINSVIFDHDAVEQQLKTYYQCPILNLENVVFESYGNLERIR